MDKLTCIRLNLLLKVFTKEGIDYNETFAPIPMIDSIMVILFIFASQSWAVD